MPVTLHEVKGYDDHQNLINSLNDKKVCCWYVGEKSSDGLSWCGDCRETEPIIQDYLKSMKIKNDDELHVIYTEIEKEYYKNPDCDFRTDPKIKLTNIPTLYIPKDGRTLVEKDCGDKNLLHLFFEDISEA